LIRVLRDMGHTHDASAVAIAKQKQLRAAGKIKGRVRSAMHWLYGALSGFGYRPLRTVGWMAGLWLVCSLAFWAGADRHAAIGPANPLIKALRSIPMQSGCAGMVTNAAKRAGQNAPLCPMNIQLFSPSSIHSI
jgi:hypothetical protein